MEAFLLWMRQRNVLIAIGLLALGLCASGMWMLRPNQSTEPTALAAPADASMIDPTAAPTVEPQIVVYISGAVQAPDVYSLPTTARVKDLVVAAGGLAPDADADQINLAAKLTDGAHVTILRRGAVTQAAPAGDSSTLDINSASASDFEKLDGIGTAIAQRIVDYRTANGPFATVEDLRKVTGVTSTVYGKISAKIRVGAGS